MALCCCRWLSVSDIVDALDVAQPTGSHHLSILKKAGLVQSQRRGKQVFYTMKQERLVSACCQVAEEFAPDHEVKVVVIKGE